METNNGAACIVTPHHRLQTDNNKSNNKKENNKDSPTEGITNKLARVNVQKYFCYCGDNLTMKQKLR